MKSINPEKKILSYQKSSTFTNFSNYIKVADEKYSTVDFYLISFFWKFCLCTKCVCTICMPGAHGIRDSHPTSGLQMVLSYFMGVGNHTQVLRKNKCSKLLIHLFYTLNCVFHGGIEKYIQYYQI